MINDYTDVSDAGDSVEGHTLVRRISERVVRSVAAAKNEDPAEMRPALYDAIDPDALDTIFESDGVSVAFTWHHHRITIDETGTIDVVPVECRQPTGTR